jgi:putative molybdopterin biosynthesis protein
MALFSIKSLHSFEQLKLLADPRRLAILRQLMAGPCSLTMIGNALSVHPAWVRHHLKQLEAVDLVELVDTRVNSGIVEKFYRARAGGFLLQEMILPENPGSPVIVFSGSHDLAVELLASQLSKHLTILFLPVGSLDGLVTLRQNLCNLSGTHLLDQDGEYNLPFIRRFFPDRLMQVVTIADREQGLMTAAGNPKAIHSLQDLTRNDLIFINRNPGSGTRLWLDVHLEEMDIPTSCIRGYEKTVSTHTECAQMVSEGKADVALGLRAAAHAVNLDFIPIFHERYDIVYSQEQSLLLAPLLDTLQTGKFRRGIEALTGYETKHTGDQIPL